MANKLQWPSIKNIVPQLFENKYADDIIGSTVFAHTKHDGTCVGIDTTGKLWGRRTAIADGALTYQKAPLNFVRSIDVIKLMERVVGHDLLPLINTFVVYGELACNSIHGDKIGWYHVFGIMFEPICYTDGHHKINRALDSANITYDWRDDVGAYRLCMCPALAKILDDLIIPHVSMTYSGPLVDIDITDLTRSPPVKEGVVLTVVAPVTGKVSLLKLKTFAEYQPTAVALLTDIKDNDDDNNSSQKSRLLSKLKHVVVAKHPAMRHEKAKRTEIIEGIKSAATKHDMVDFNCLTADDMRAYMHVLADEARTDSGVDVNSYTFKKVLLAHVTNQFKVWVQQLAMQK
jgi:hypothetical protein